MAAAIVEERRAAIVLQLLGNELGSSVFAGLPPAQSNRLQAMLGQLRDNPPLGEEIDDVMEEFERFLRFAGDAKPQGEADVMPARSATPVEEEEEPVESPKIFKIANPMKQLTQLQPFQIAGALQQESARAIAIVLGCVSSETAGEVLQYLTEDQRNNVVLEMCEAPTAPPALLTELVRTTVEKGIRLDQSSITDASEKAVDRLAEVLRSMKRTVRNQLVAFLDTNRAETAGNIKKKLYVFDDIRYVSARSIQKLLSRVESSTLASALNGADAEDKNKVLSNLSKRARAALEEEIEMAKDMSEEEREEGRRGICQVMAEMDQEGELTLET